MRSAVGVLACLAVADAYAFPRLRRGVSRVVVVGAAAVAAATGVSVDPDQKLKAGIAGFYDGLSPLWEEVWGEHLHHGYYDPSSTKEMSLQEHQQAQVLMVDNVLDWALKERVGFAPARALDVGCGIGGSSRHISKRFGCDVRGITLSPVQVGRATSLSGPKCSFAVQDALALTPEYAGKHDLVWSLESGEHMPDKPRFVNNLVKACAPGGQVVLVTWCHRDLKPGEKDLTKLEKLLLATINACYYLPKWCSVADYEKQFQERGLVDVRREDWTANIAPFWPAVIKTAARPRNALKLLKTGVDGVRSAVAMFLMVVGYKLDLIKFGLVTATKPNEEAPPAL
ncbi:tocopherol o-methyltransferase [Pelagophyceae sp. CCMP2097]|nr:tocopherol o-methyltransferase [Pelagophyceae sp. CCMP2097]